MRVINPKKNIPHGVLSVQDIEEYLKINFDRVLMDYYFGRLCVIWNVRGFKWKWVENLYDYKFCFWVALTNLHDKFHPLRADDGHNYNQLCIRSESISNEQTEKRRKTKKRYRRSSADVLIINIGRLQDAPICLPRSLTKMIYKLSN